MDINEDRETHQQVGPPLNLGLNDGTWSAGAAAEVMRQFTGRTALRNYSHAENQPLLDAIALVDKVGPEHIYLANGSGPILKQCVPHLIKSNILASPWRVVKHLISKTGYPIITPSVTYCKVPRGASAKGLTVAPVEIGPEDGFALSIDKLRAAIRRHDGVVYIVNPNNPTGNLLIDRDSLKDLLREFPRSIFWIDEAYVQYVEPDVHQPVSDLVPSYDNLVVSRSFSFAYGLAALRLGYLLARPRTIQEFRNQVPDYKVGGLQEAIGVASLLDPAHLPHVRKETRAARDFIRGIIDRQAGLQSFPSHTNFVYARFTDGRTGPELAKRMAKRGVLIKQFEPAMGYSYDPYWRLTVGLEDENRLMMERLVDVLDEYRA